MKRKWRTVLFLSTLTAGCAASDGVRRIEIAERNDLGATGLETSCSDVNGDSVFELRALDAGEGTVGEVRLHVGVIPVLLAHLPGTDQRGSEIFVAAAGDVQHWI